MDASWQVTGRKMPLGERKRNEYFCSVMKLQHTYNKSCDQQWLINEEGIPSLGEGCMMQFQYL